MLTMKNGEITEVKKLDPDQHYPIGACAEMVLDFMREHENDDDMPVFGDGAVTDILNLVCEETGGIVDAKLTCIFGIYFGMCLME